MSKTVGIGSGAAWWGDRVEPAVLNAAKGDLDYLCFETMAEYGKALSAAALCFELEVPDALRPRLHGQHCL